MSNLAAILFGLVFILAGILFLTSNQSFAYSLIAFGVVLEMITLIRYLWEQGKIK